ncbi:MAG: hypothetical protein KTV77_05400 [Wolbachia endosymbiont of Fragariocoptes setiger]|nr:hypothetical protein [Wolbachia endosymbiont of Fragariocoptes setiger]
MIGGEKNNFAKFVNRIILPLVQTTRAFRTSKVYLNKESEKFGTVIRHYDKNAVALSKYNDNR